MSTRPPLATAGRRTPPSRIACSNRFAVVPGVTAVTFSINGLLQNRDGENDLRAEDSTATGESQVDRVARAISSGRHPARRGKRLRRTRYERATDRDRRSMRRWPGSTSPARIRSASGSSWETHQKAWEVVGVVRTVKQHGPRDADEPAVLSADVCARDEPDPVSVRFLVRTATDPAATLGLLEGAVRAEDKTLRVISATVTDLLNRTIVQERTVARSPRRSASSASRWQVSGSMD